MHSIGTRAIRRAPEMRALRFSLALLGVLLGAARLASAQQPASPYVPLDDASYRYVDALLARGLLRDLSALERPYTTAALRRSLEAARATNPPRVTASYIDALLTRLAPLDPPADSATDSSRFRARLSGDLYATAQTSGRRELMLADRNRSVEPGADIRLSMTAGPVVAGIRALIDNRLNEDPEFAGRKDRAIAGRTEDAYVAGQWQYAELFLGRLARNWGPPLLDGLQLGSYAYTYDHLYSRIGTDRVHLASVAAKLDDSFQPNGVYARYFYTHRLAARFGGLELAASEGYVASGVGRSYDLPLLNPFNIYALSWRNEKVEGNYNIGGEAALRTRRFGTYAGQLLVDDVQIDRCNPLCREPSSYGLTLSAEGLPLGGEQRWFGAYTRVSNLTYRTPAVAERYASFDVGLGRGFSDYDEARVGVDLALLPAAPLRVYLARRRQGEGDYRAPYPAPADYATTPAIFSGVVQTVTRLAVQGAAALPAGFTLSGDVGVNRTTNDERVRGRTRSSLAARVRLLWTPAWSIPLAGR